MCIIIIDTNKDVTGSTLHFKMRVFHMWLKVKKYFQSPHTSKNNNYVATVTCSMNTGLIDTRSIATYYAMHNSYMHTLHSHNSNSEY